MTKYYYKALTDSGKTVEGNTEANNEDALLSELSGKGYYPLEIKHSSAGTMDNVKKSSPGFFASRKVTARDITVITTQMASLISSGFTIQRTLNALAANMEKPALAKLLTGIEESVRGGETFSAALEKYPALFSPLYVNMVRAGESGGILDQIFRRLSEMRTREQKLLGRVKSAMIYPAIMIFVMTTAVIVLLTFVLPKFMTMFKDMGGALPLPTLILIRTSDFATHYWWIILLSLAGIFFLYKKYSSTEDGANHIDHLKLKILVIGGFLKKVAVIRFSRTLGILLASGVPLIESLNLVKNIMGNRVILAATDKVKKDVTEGTRLAHALSVSGIFPPLLIQMVSLGEEAGTMDEMLLHISDNYEEEIDQVIAGFTSMLEPVIIVVMGLVVGFIVMAMLLPIFDLNTMIQ